MWRNLGLVCARNVVEARGDRLRLQRLNPFAELSDDSVLFGCFPQLKEFEQMNGRELWKGETLGRADVFTVRLEVKKRERSRVQSPLSASSAIRSGFMNGHGADRR